MMDITLLGVVLIFLSIGLNIQTAESCFCPLQHPQDKFCTSEIVILANVTGKLCSVKYQNNVFQYKIKIIKVLKGSENAKQIKYVKTNPRTSCGIKLDQGRYVLSGRQIKCGIEVMMCDLVEHWDLLYLKEQENYNQTYQMGCNCTISTCSGRSCCPKSVNECKWESNSPQSLEYACLKDSNGICSWYRPCSKVDQDATCKA